MPLLFWCEQGQSGIILDRWVQALSAHIFTSKPNPTSDISRSAAGWEVERQDLVKHREGGERQPPEKFPKATPILTALYPYYNSNYWFCTLL